MSDREPTPLFDACVGIGHDCETTHQLRRLSGDERAHVFDWLRLGVRAVHAAIGSDFRDLVTLSGADVIGGEYVRDRVSGIDFFHDFRPATGAPLTRDDLARQLPGVRRKFTVLAQRFRATAASPRRILYVRQDRHLTETVDDVVALRDVIAARHPAHRFGLLWLRAAAPARVDDLPPGIVFRTVASAPGRWEGDDAAWDELVETLPVSPAWRMADRRRRGVGDDDRLRVVPHVPAPGGRCR